MRSGRIACILTAFIGHCHETPNGAADKRAPDSQAWPGPPGWPDRDAGRNTAGGCFICGPVKRRTASHPIDPLVLVSFYEVSGIYNPCIYPKALVVIRYFASGHLYEISVGLYGRASIDHKPNRLGLDRQTMRLKHDSMSTERMSIDWMRWAQGRRSPRSTPHARTAADLGNGWDRAR